MKATELKNKLRKHPTANVRFVLPDGAPVAAHAHVTEVARVDKRFIDCGGTLRNDSLCRLQTWVASDTDHRLTAGKLANILAKAAPILLTDDLEVDVEHETGFISQFPLKLVEIGPDEVLLHLTERHTACLAQDKCKSPPPLSEFNALKFDFRNPPAVVGCCGGKSSCN